MDNNEIRYDNQKIVDVEINKEVRKAFLDYSMSVIVSRALPDAGRAEAGTPPYSLHHV